ncbi:choice-of-anchor tandem repeat GloVer-containing protein [Ideonella sp.]|uniref:choice-of-anchor tandem repeat GloVer-containing protein n=1 Tax=Ideonella sp. TaxID=1929293 RepID=UPI0035B47974
MTLTFRILTWGATALACALVNAQTPDRATNQMPAGESFKVLHDFEGAPLSGRPNAALVLGPDGNFYGTTSEGGVGTHCRPYGCGTIYRMKPNGTTKMLHSFDFVTDGQFPWASLLLASDGNFYGTTYYGGPRDGGTLFRMDADGNFELLYAFKRGGRKGALPAAALVEGPDGSLYGTTVEGGTGQAPICFVNDASGCGAIFKYSRKSGVVRMLYSFTGQDGDGAFPSGPLMLAKDGNFYGTTWQGGKHQYGTLYRMTPEGEVTVLHDFDSSAGDSPSSGLVEASDGVLYGTTTGGGSGNGGTVFRITTTGDYSLVHQFDSLHEGNSPTGTLVFGPENLLYGVLRYGGDDVNCKPAGCGAAYSVSTSGTYKTLHNFNGSDGVFPSDGLVRLGEDKLLGTTEFGGSVDSGVIFTIKP